MANSNTDIKTRIAELRAEILSYKPGQAKPCDDERVVFPEKLVIGVITGNIWLGGSFIVPALRHVLHGDVEESKHADERRASTDDQEQYITDYISAITETCYRLSLSTYDETLSRLVAKVGCVVLCLYPIDVSVWPRLIQKVKEITGHPPICAVDSPSEVSQKHKHILEKQDVTGIYGVILHDRSLSDQEHFELLTFLHGCLVEGDVRFAHNVDSVYKNVPPQQIYEAEKERFIEARREISMKNEKILTLQQEYNDVSSSRDKLVIENSSLRNELKDVQEKKEQTEKEMNETANRAKHMEEMYKQSKLKYEDSLIQFNQRQKEMVLIQQENHDLQTKLHDISSSHDSLVKDNAILKNELRDVREKKDQTAVAMAESKNTSERMKEMYKKNENELRSTKLRLDALMETVKKTEETAKEESEGLKTEKEEERARFQEENQPIKLAMKEEIASKDQNIEQLEREIWKLRTKIQLESEMRSAEQKKKSEKPQWLESIIPWIASGKQAQTGTSATRQSSGGKPSTSTCDDLLSTEEQPNDDFADILKQIADDLYDDSKIDSFGGQLGILHGDIERALKTNYRFHRITSEGTRQMLQQWRRGVSREDERRSLRRALLAAKLVDLADQYVPEETGSGSKEEHPKDVILSPETNEDTTTTTTDHHNAPLQFDPPTNTNEDTSTTDRAPLQVDPSSETNEEVVHESINSQESGDLSKPSTTDVHHESEDMSSHDTLGEGFPTSEVGEDITTSYQDLICHLASNETSSDKLLIIFFVNVLLNIPHRAFGL